MDCKKRKNCYARFYNKVSTIDGLDKLSMQKEQNGGPYAILLILVDPFWKVLLLLWGRKKSKGLMGTHGLPPIIA